MCEGETGASVIGFEHVFRGNDHNWVVIRLPEYDHGGKRYEGKLSCVEQRGNMTILVYSQLLDNDAKTHPNSGIQKRGSSTA